MAKVILNCNVIFDEEKYTLSSRNFEHDPIILGATNSRCLGFFIANHGEVIYKKDLLHHGWGKFGTVVAEGSMWQAISQLRKAFEHFNLDGSLIITVPRIGYKLSSLLSIEQVTTSESTPESEEKVPEQVILPAAVLPIVSPPKTTQLTDTPSVNPFSLLSTRSRKIWLILGALNLVLLTCFYLYQRKPLVLPELTSPWHFSHKVNNASIYVQNSKPALAYITEQAIARLANNTLLPDGTAAAYIYINNTPDNSLSSYFLCKREITERDNGCISSFMVDKKSH